MAIDAGSIYSEVRINLADLEKDIAKLDAKFNVIAKKNASTTTTVKSDWQKAFSAIKIASVAAIASITASFTAGIKIGASFEQSMANVASVAKATAEDLAALNAAAAEAGETTRFTASEAADAMYSLASAGLSASDAIDALNGVLLFSGATQSDLATSSALIVSLLKQYKLQAGDAGDVSNVLAAAIGNSLANMDKLKTSLQQTGSVAGALNISIEDTVGVLEALFDAGYTGEKAGTALRNIYSYLADSTSTVTQQLVGMGAEVDKINPQFNDMADIIDYLNGLGLDTGDVFAAFGNEIGSQMVTLLSTGGDAIRTYTDEITGTTDAADMYATQNDTLSGSFDKLKSAIENTAIEITEAFTPAVKPMLDTLTSLVKVLNKIPEPLKVFLTLVVGGTTIAVAGATAFGLLTAAVTASGVALGAVFAPITAAVAGVAALTTGISLLVKHNKKVTSENWSKLVDELGVSEELLGNINLILGDIENKKAFAKLASELDLSYSQLKDFKTGMDDSNLTVDNLSDTVTTLSETLGVSRESMLELMSASGLVTDQGVQDMINYNLNRIEVAKQMQASNDEVAKSAAATAEAEKKANADVITSIKLAAAQKQKAVDVYDQAYADIDRDVKLGILSETDANEQRISANKTLIDSLGDVDDRYAVVSGSMIDAAARIRILTAKTEGLTEAEAAEKEALESKINAEAYAKTITQSYTEKLEDLGTTSKELRALEEARAKATIEASDATDTAKASAIAAIEAYYNGLDSQDVIDDNEEMIDQADTYQDKINALTLSTQELRAIEEQRAIDLINASDAEDDAKTTAIAKVKEYYNTLNNQDEIAANKAKMEAFTAANQEYLDEVEAANEEEAQAAADAQAAAAELTAEAWSDAFNSVEGVVSDLSSLFDALSDNAVSALEDEMEALEESLGLADETDLEEAQSDLADELESLKSITDAYDEAIAAAQESGDASSEAALIAAKAAQEAADAETLAEYQAAVDKAAIEEEYAEKEAEIEYEYDLKSWKLSLLAALASAASAQLSTYKKYGFTPAGFAASAAGAIESGVQVATIVANKPTLATGGIVLPSSGGVETIQAENGYGELSLNAGPSGDALLSEFAQRVASYGNTGTNSSSSSVIQLYMDSKLVSTGVAKNINNGTVRINLK
jgi:TP901 family phage tail tape measure protein